MITNASGQNKQLVRGGRVLEGGGRGRGGRGGCVPGRGRGNARRAQQQVADDEKARLAAEIAKIEAELERKRLEEEIRQMEAAIAAAKEKEACQQRQIHRVHQPENNQRGQSASQSQSVRPSQKHAVYQPQDHQDLPCRYRPPPTPIYDTSQPLPPMETVSPQIDYIKSDEDYAESECDEEDQGTESEETYEESEYEEVIEETMHDDGEIVEDVMLTSEATPIPPMRNPLLASIALAAEAREQRLEETDGQLIMRDATPEVASQLPHGPPQLSFSITEMVTKKARDREKRLEAGGEKKMTKVKEKSEYKQDFSNICLEAASMGRLTRLNEHVIESVATEKTPEQEWKSNGLLAIQWRSNHMSVIHEAAQTGEMTKLPEHVVSNFPEEEDDQWDYENDDFAQKISPRMAQLLELNTKAGSGQEKVDKLVMGRKEENGSGTSLLVRPMVCYQDVNEVKLPRQLPPKVDPKKAQEKLRKMTEEAEAQHRPMKDIGHDVAERAWERRARLDRPGTMPKIKEKCECPYCEDPSPYQTYAYKVLEKRIKDGEVVIRDPEEEKRRERELRRTARKAKQFRHPPHHLHHHQSSATIEGEGDIRGSADADAMDQKRYLGEHSVLRETKSASNKSVIAESVKENSSSAVAPPGQPEAADSGCGCIIL